MNVDGDMKKRMLIAALILLAGCGNRAIYENVQEHNKNACSKAPPLEYQDCLERANKSYREYSSERKELMDEQ